MTADELLELLRGIESGTAVNGLHPNKAYRYEGVEPYPARGKNAHLAGEAVVVLLSHERKRKRVILFLEPLLFITLSNSDLGFSERPLARYKSESGIEYPNVHEYSTHYKAMARYIRKRIGSP
jgi:hypothetical protein